MFQYDKNNRKVPVEHYRPQKHVRFNNTVEHYGSSDSKCPKWLWILLVIVAVIVLVVLVLMLVKSRKMHSLESPDSTAGFGFRFY